MSDGLKFNDKKITVIVSEDHISWFILDEMTKILNIKNKGKILCTYKQYLKLFHELTNIIKIVNLIELNKNSLLINEIGLHKLIDDSKNKKFKQYFIETIIPLTRDITKNNFANKCNEYKCLLKDKEEETISLTKELDNTKKLSIRLKQKINKYRVVNNNNVIYVITSNALSSENKFIVKACESVVDIKSQISSELDLYICATFKINDFKTFENIFWNIFDKYKFANETVLFPYEALINSIRYIIENFQEDIDYIKENIKNLHIKNEQDNNINSTTAVSQLNICLIETYYIENGKIKNKTLTEKTFKKD